MAEGNGLDGGAACRLLAQVTCYVLEIRQDVADLKRDLAEKVGKIEFQTEIGGFRREVSGLRQAVVQYHSSVIGHGVLVSELEARVRRFEDHRHLPSMIAAE